MSARLLCYLASPYTDAYPDVQTMRFELAALAAGQLIKQGYFVFSPITHTHPIAIHSTLPTDWQYWAEYDELMIRKCDLFVILTLDGWKESKGVQAELLIARNRRKQCFLMCPLDSKLLPYTE